MFDARHHPRPTKSLCAKFFSRKRRQCLDSDALAYGYIHPDHISKSKYQRTLSSFTMYGHHGYDRPPPPRFYRNEFASESYVSPDPSQTRPHRRPRPSASTSTLDLPPRYTSSPRPEVRRPRTARDAPPQQPPRPAPKNVHFGEDPARRDTAQGNGPVNDLASRLGGIWADFDPQRARENADNEALWMEAIDRELFLGEEEQLVEHVESQRSRKDVNAPVSKTKTGLVNYSKTWAFSNSRLPPHQPPFKTYLETWRLICKAASFSAQVYQRPQRDEREYFIAAEWRHRTKAMVLKSNLLDDQNLIVFSIRGSQIKFTDWNVNLQPAPAAPEGFLDDGQNACHSGFLKVAKAMIAPVAARLRQILEQDPSRCSSSLLITGHSAGGAVASLLYMHMLATTVESELNILTGCFKRVHCVTFGAPPVSFLPLQKPRHMRADKSLFLSFINEGDPVVRAADKAYMLSLAKLLAGSKGGSNCSATTLVKKASHAVLKAGKEDKNGRRAPYWPVPEAPLSNAGRLVVLREKPGSQKNPSVEAVVTEDDKLRNVLFGDVPMHQMSVYQQRVEALAFAAIRGEDGG